MRTMWLRHSVAWQLPVSAFRERNFLQKGRVGTASRIWLFVYTTEVNESSNPNVGRDCSDVEHELFQVADVP